MLKIEGATGAPLVQEILMLKTVGTVGTDMRKKGKLMANNTNLLSETMHNTLVQAMRNFNEGLGLS